MSLIESTEKDIEKVDDDNNVKILVIRGRKIYNYCKRNTYGQKIYWRFFFLDQSNLGGFDSSIP